MANTVVVRGHVIGSTTVRVDEPIPAETTEVEVVLHLRDKAPDPQDSVGAYVRGLPPGTRTKEDIDRQIREERDSWARLMRLYLDANVIVYMVEGAPALRQDVLGWVDRVEEADDGLLLTSYLSTVECRAKPLREGVAERIAAFDGFFARDRLFLADVTRAVLDRATALRASHGFKTADATHLATALIHDADTFLTADTAFRRFADMRVVVVDPLARK